MIQHSTELHHIIKFMQLVRKHVDEDCTVKMLLTLLGTVTMAGSDQSSIGKALNLSRSTMSKNVADLTALTSRKLQGPGLIENKLDPMNLTMRLPTLTRKGVQVIQKLVEETWGMK